MIERTSASYILVLAVAVFSVGCQTSKPPPVPMDPGLRETAIFECKRDVQAKKKARFEKLPGVLRRVMGDHRILKEFSKRPTLADMRGTALRFPLQGDSGGLWKAEENAQYRTMSGSIRNIEGTEIVSLFFGQPGRVFTLPLEVLNRTKTGLQGSFENSEMLLRPLDDDHVLVEAKTAGTGRISALVRTYATQSFAEESKIIVPDYPIFSKELSDESCEDIGSETNLD